MRSLLASRARGLLLASSLLGLACRGPAPPPPAKASHQVTRSAKAQPYRGPDLETRRAAFEARVVVPSPAQLPPAWRRLPSHARAKLTAIFHEVRVRADRAPPFRQVRMQLRLFGSDTQVRERLLAGLHLLDLPGLAAGQLPRRPVEAGGVRWSISLHPLVAPAGEARETRVQLAWTRRPPMPDPEGLDRCRKPHPVEIPSEAPSWLARWASTGSAKRLVTASVAHREGQRIIELRMLYRNGWSHDEAVGKLAKLAERRRFLRLEGHGSRQRWKAGAGQLSLQPTLEELMLGCRIAGPVLQLRYLTPLPDRAPRSSRRARAAPPR